jgi:hypothetical protein
LEERPVNVSYSTLGLLVGVLFLLVGLLCMVRRDTGDSVVETEFLSLRIRIRTDVPGLVIAAFGALVILITRS